MSFKEYFEYAGGDKYATFYEHLRYGGMPFAVLKIEQTQKEIYLRGLFDTTYLKDIIEHNKFKKTNH